MTATVPLATLRQVVRAVRGRLAAEISDFSAWPTIAGVLTAAEEAPLGFVLAEQQRQAAVRGGADRELEPLLALAEDDDEHAEARREIMRRRRAR